MVRKFRNIEPSIATFLSDLSNERSGFAFGEPMRPDENSLACVLPIFQRQVKDRAYITLPETEKVKLTDTGKINQMLIQNLGKEPLYVRTGTLLVGGTQERVLTHSFIVLPGQEIAADARCVHASKGIRPNANVTYGGIMPQGMDSALYGAGFKAADQNTFWASVQNETRTMASHFTGTMSNTGPQEPIRRRRTPAAGLSRRKLSPTQLSPTRMNTTRQSPPFIGGNSLYSGPTWDMGDDPLIGSSNPLIGVSNSLEVPGGEVDQIFTTHVGGGDDLVAQYRAFTGNIDSVLSKVKLEPEQAGLALIDERGLSSLEVFDVHASWAALHADAVRRSGSNLVRDCENDVFQWLPEKVRGVVVKALGAEFTERVIYERRAAGDEPYHKVVGVTSEKLVGEATYLVDRIVHLVLNRTA